MRKAASIFFALAALTFGLAYIKINALGLPQKPVLIKDGATAPASIPDYVAYEFFIKSLISSPQEGAQGQRRTEAFAHQTGLENEDSQLLLMDAQAVYQEISSFDRRIREIKDQTWPNPPRPVWGQLKVIQKQKEDSIIQTVESLFAKRNQKMVTQLRNFINSHVKARIKGFADQPNPGQNHRPHNDKPGLILATFFGFLPIVKPQMQGDETVYIYANAYNAGNGYVYGSGYVTATASSYGHEYNTRTEMYGPCGQFEIGTGTNVAPLYYDGIWCDDLFSFFVVAVQSCPIANTFIDAGQNQTDVVVPPYFSLGEFDPTFTTTPISVNGSTSRIAIGVNASQRINANTHSVHIEFSPYSQSGSANMQIGGSTTIRMSGGAFQRVEGTYKALSASGDGVQMKATAMLAGPSGGATILAPAGKTSNAILVINIQ
jgi:hypothetical protein